MGKYLDKDGLAHLWGKIKAADGVLSEGLANEQAARESADTELQKGINTETANRQAAVNNISGALTTETEERKAADAALQAAINSEQAARTAADAALQTAIGNEETAREAADAALSGSITALQEDITDEATAREAADALKADKATTYTKTETNNLLAVKADASALSSYYTKTETDDLLADKADAASVYTKTETSDAIASAVAQEASEREAADATLQTEITKETTAREAADALKADKATTYTKTETSNLLVVKADAASVYTKSETDDLLAAKADASTLANYYTKTQTYSKSEVDALVEVKISFQVVDALPAEGKECVIYLVPMQQAETADSYDEYMWINGAWEHIGSTKTDLSDYYTKAETEGKLAAKADASTIYTRTEIDGKFATKADTSTLANYYTKTQADNLLSAKADAASVYTKTETDNAILVETDARQNADSLLSNAIDTKQAKITGAATTITSSNLNASRALVSDANGKVAASVVNSTELAYLAGVTSNVQIQLNAKQAKITGAATTITASNLTASRVLVANASGKVAVSDITSTELSYMQGVTSNIQRSLDNKVETRNYAAFVQTTEAGLDGKMPQLSPLNSYVHARWNMATPDAKSDAKTLQFVPLVKEFRNVNYGTHLRWEYRARYADGHTLEGSIIVNSTFNHSYSGNTARLVVTGGAPFVAYQLEQMQYNIDLYLEAGIDGDATNYLQAVDLWLPDPGYASYDIWNGTKTSETQWGTQSSAQGEYTYNDCQTLSLDFAKAYKPEYHPCTQSAVLNYQISKAFKMAVGEYYTKTQTAELLKKKEDKLEEMTTAEIDELLEAVCV